MNRQSQGQSREGASINTPTTASVPTVIRVAVPVPLARQFDYGLPAELPTPPVGGRVRVPFAGRNLVGICMQLDPADAHDKLKPVTEVIDTEPALTDELFELAGWMADYYLHPIGEVLATMLPAQIRRGAALRIAREESWVATGHTGDLKRAPRQASLLEVIRSGTGATTRSLYDLGYSRSIITALAGKGLIRKGSAPGDDAPMTPHAALETGPTPTEDQANALQALQALGGGFQPALLEGITGSGKTEIYLRLIERVLADSRQALVLVPEIALTPQTLARFEARFGTDGAVGTLHSNLTDAERAQTWLKCRAGQIRVIIGTRSAVLAPFRNLGLIVVDEEHDGSFKQQDGLRYSARDVAVKRAQALGIGLLLGSATPSLETLHNANRGRYAHVSLQQRAGGARPPDFYLLDIRGHTLHHGLSNDLVRAVRSHLERDSQVLVFLNRRGYAPSYLCAACGWQSQCASCDTRMTLHQRPKVLVCHHCGRREPVIDACGNCGAAAMMAVGVGTQRTEEGLAELFPGVPLIRVDSDTTRTQRQLESQLADIHQSERAILLGTQMLAKGHHFPRVTLVAVINADGGFLSADFRAPERTAQLITQVAGRAGRAQAPGEVWIQTYQPDNPLLRSLIEQGYPGFAQQELAVRESAGLPPYRPMALIRSESADATSALQFLQSLPPALPGDLEVLGPAPAPIARVADRYRYQLMVLADNRSVLHAGLARLRPPARANLRWSLDIDPYDTF